ncbi:glycosyltransferase family 39 protein [Spirosoma montaniterrae]|uniref:glycosyltransferase family 39 protein n=1 Tax=Spirosoma montaniterrae TaxID=1178516 RepID=UPI001E290625|nr:glycosyltransferase family 39 protein [Spirosoma montaniterrae]
MSVSLLITLLAIGTVLSARRAARPFGEQAALFAMVITAISCFFMEMNFLEPESWIGILGLNAYASVTQNESRPGWGWFWAGVLLGLAMSFKSVAAFYVMGFGVFGILLWLTGRQTIGQTVGRGALIGIGFALPLALAALYFHLTGRLSTHLEWTYIYPLQGYPAHTLFLTKFFIKLGWFLLLLLATLVVALQQPYREQYARTPALWLAMLLGLFSCVALMKTQASHYFFPAAVFFALHMAFIINQWLVQQGPKPQQLQRRLVLGGGGAGILVVASLLLYRPNALKRFVTLADYSGEEQTAAFIQQQVKPNQYALFFDNAMSLYYLSDREPNVPFIFTEMQTTHYLSKHPDTYRKALADTSLKLVVFGNRASVIDDSTALNKPSNVRAIGQLRAGLQQHFMPVQNPNFPLKYWVRKQ